MLIGIFGANGFVGTSIYNHIKLKYPNTIGISRNDYLNYQNTKFNILINAAMPSKRYWAKLNPQNDFEETVIKTKFFIENYIYDKFIQISSISSRCQNKTIYGINKKKSEDICLDLKNSLIVRLGPLYGDKLSKGVIIDMLNNTNVYVSGESKYAFTDIKWFGNWLSNNLDLNGIKEVGPNNYILLKDLASNLNSSSKFDGEIDNQIINTDDKYDLDVKKVYNFINRIKNEI